jgi:hypothetical protein
MSFLMKTELKACLINCALPTIVAILFASKGQGIRDFGQELGLIFLVWGGISLVVSIILFIGQQTAIGRGVLLSAVVLVLIGYAACTNFPFLSR